MPLGDYLADSIKNSLYRGVAFPNPTNLIFRLSTTTLSADGTGATEPTGWYSAVTQARNGTNFSASSGGSASANNNELAFGTNDSTQTFYIYVEDDSANLWFYDNTGEEVSAGVDVVIPAGNWTFDLDAVTQSASVTVSNYLATGLINQITQASAFTFPSSISFGFSTNATQPGADGSNITEPSGGWYAREDVVCSTGNFSAPSAGSATSNVSDIDFNSGSAVDETATLNWEIIWDTEGTPNFLLAKQGPNLPLAITNGQTTVKIAAGEHTYDVN